LLSVAAAVAGRGARWALVIALAAGALLAPLALIQTSWGVWLLLSMLFCGLALGMISPALLVTAGALLVSGRPAKADLAAAFGPFVMLPLIAGQLIEWLLAWEGAVNALIYLAPLFLGLAALMLLLSPWLDAGSPPRARHAPLTHRTRSAWAVALLGMLPIAAIVAGVAVLLPALIYARFRWDSLNSSFFAVALITAAVFLIGIAYVMRWSYRIHGELAAMQPTQRLLKPGASVWVGLFAPLGFPISLMMLWLVLDERARQQGGKGVSAWAVVWAIVLPPAAMGMLQSASNQAGMAGQGPPAV
jgi:hypothetical protein